MDPPLALAQSTQNVNITSIATPVITDAWFKNNQNANLNLAKEVNNQIVLGMDQINANIANGQMPTILITTNKGISLNVNMMVCFAVGVVMWYQ